MSCPSCGWDNPEGVKFCGECGASLQPAPACARCGFSNPPGVKFCHECGQSLTEAAPAAAARTPEPSRAVPTTLASGRYQVQRFLGEGGKKRVYLAHDTKLDGDVAIALIKTEGLDEHGLTRVRREAQAMGRLRDHPHIVTVHDIGDEDGQPYIVQEVLQGGSLEDQLLQAEDHRLPLDQAVRIAEQLCQALEHAHGLGIIHRDVKPGNVALTRDGTAKLGDFGLAVAADRSRLTQEGMMVGTVAYMPPEQAMGNEATPRADLYSLGCVLYEMVCGLPPFVGDESVAIITQHLNNTPVYPSWHRPELPPPLETIILRLLEKDPGDRPVTAAEVRQGLASIDLTSRPSVEAAAPERATAPGGQDPLYRRTFVGREKELRQLEAVFDNALSGQGALVMVVGEPGIGKTTLCEQLATFIALRGGRTLVGHCYEEGSLSLPYLAFVEAMRSYVLDRDPEALRGELGSGASQVARIVSEVRDRIEVELAPPGDPEEERYRLLQAVTAFLRNAANVQPLCIVLEDLHDADRGTLDLLTHIARNLSGARLLIVGTYRDVEVDRMHALSSALAELRRVGTFSRVLLRGLGPDEVHRMLAAIGSQEIPWRFAEAVHRQTEGNPLFIQEVLRYLSEEGIIAREGGRWEQAGPTLPAMAIPEGLRDVIGKRLSRLSGECNSLLAVGAVIGREFALETLRAVAHLEEEQLTVALEEAVSVGVLEERSQARDVRYRFAHAFFRQTLYEEMIAPRRIRLHQQVARALEQQYAHRLQEHAAELAEHFSYSSDADDLAKAVEYGERAAQRSLAVFAYGEAARLLEQAIEIQEVLDPNDKAKRCDLLMELGEALMPAGEPRRVVDTVAPEALAFAEALDDSDRAAKVCYMAGVSLARFGAAAILQTQDWRHWATLMDGHAKPGTADRVLADIMLSTIRYADRQWAEAWRLAEGALKLARQLDDPDALFGAAFLIIQPPLAPHLAEERHRLAEEFAGRSREGVTTRRTAQVLWGCFRQQVDRGETAKAEELLRRLEEMANLTRDPELLLSMRQSGALFAVLEGRLEDVLELSQQLANQAEELGVPLRGKQLANVVSFRPLLHLGRAEEALTPLDEGAQAFEPAFRALGLAHLGRREEAQDALARTMNGLNISEEQDEIPLLFLVMLLEAAVLVGERAAASLLAGRLSGSASLVADNLSYVARHLGGAAELIGDYEQAREYYREALNPEGKARIRPEIALTRLQLAALLLEHYPNERNEALEHLDFVVSEFRDMIMRPALERALRLKMDVQGISSTDVMTSIDAVAAIVESEQPDLRRHAAPDGTVTLLFTDIEASTPLNERLGDQRWMELLRAHNARVREELRSHDGYEVKTEGDGFMVAFGSARKALQCAIAVQRSFAKHNESAEEPLRIRIGLHTGEAIQEAGDFYGKHVNLAARIADQAKGGEVLVSSLLKELTDSAGDISFDEGRDVELKGLTGTQRVYPVGWE